MQITSLRNTPLLSLQFITALGICGLLLSTGCTAQYDFKECDVGAPCDSGKVCSPKKFCVVPQCADNIRNGNEEGIDCGGACPACGEASTSACGDGQVTTGEACDDGNTGDGDYCSADCTTVTGYCGDGEKQDNEACDDEYTDACGTCNADCSGAGEGSTCGDDVVCPETEVCDDWYTDACGTCNVDCTALGTGSTCGDTVLCPETELCDDGNTKTETSCLYGTETCNACSSTCGEELSLVGPYCGDGNLDADNGETCDNGANNNGEYSGCASDCTLGPRCGDGTTDSPQEVCDDGGVANSYGGCQTDCSGLNPYCGDATINGEEECNEGTANNNGEYSGCASDCTFGPKCGDGILNGPEECDGTASCLENCELQQDAVNEINGLVWKKCVQGMDYNPGTQECTQTAQTYQYCAVLTNSCNGDISYGSLNGTGSSGAWDTCHTLNYAGYTDWRVPESWELQTLVDCPNGAPAGPQGYCGQDSNDPTRPTINTNLFPNFPGVSFWSASSDVGSAQASTINFSPNYGVMESRNKTEYFGVLCVRGQSNGGETGGGGAPPNDCGDGVVNSTYETCDDGNQIDDENGCSASCQQYGVHDDTNPSLQWKSCLQGMVYNPATNTCTGTYSELRYCNTNDNSCNETLGEMLLAGGDSEVRNSCQNLIYAGYDDWRVPTKHELENLIYCSNGYQGPPNEPGCGSSPAIFDKPTIDTGLFPNFPEVSVWSASAEDINSSLAFSIKFSNGVVEQPTKTTPLSVLCVRDAN